MLFVNVPAGNKIAVITWCAVGPLAASICVCVCALSRGTHPSSPHRCSLLSVCVYRPDSGMEKCLPSTQNQWLLFSLLQRPPVICNEYKAHIVAHKTHTHTPHFYVHSPFTTVAGSHTNPREIGLNYKSVTLNGKKYGSHCVFSLSEHVYSWVFCHLMRLEWDLHRCSFHWTAKFIISSTV